MTDFEFDMCLRQGTLFVKLYTAGYELHSIVNHYLFRGQLALAETPNDMSKAPAVEWMGYLYAYWHYTFNESYEDIIRKAKHTLMLRMYLGLHCEDNDLAIEDLKELYRIRYR